MNALAYLTAQASYQEYRRRLDVRRVLDHYGVENDHEDTSGCGTEIIHSCLLDRVDRHHNNGDRNPSAAANVEKKLYVCYSYWGGDFFHFIQKMEDKQSFAEIVPILLPFLGESTLPIDEFAADTERRLTALFSHDDAFEMDLPSYSDRVLTPWAFVHPYLQERGISSETASRLQIGWREDDNRIIIPHFWDGKLVGWQARSLPERPGRWPGTELPLPKYRSSPGFPKADTLYYDHSGPRPEQGSVVIVESPMSVIKAVEVGLDVPVMATFGAKVSDAQIKILARFDDITIWSDDDPAGRSMSRRLARALYRQCRVQVVRPDAGKDMGDCPTAESMLDKIAGAVPALMIV